MQLYLIKTIIRALEIKCDFIKIASMDINNSYHKSSIKNKNSLSFNWDGYRERIKSCKYFHTNKKKDVIFTLYVYIHQKS